MMRTIKVRRMSRMSNQKVVSSIINARGEGREQEKLLSRKLIRLVYRGQAYLGGLASCAATQTFLRSKHHGRRDTSQQ